MLRFQHYSLHRNSPLSLFREPILQLSYLHFKPCRLGIPQIGRKEETVPNSRHVSYLQAEMKTKRLAVQLYEASAHSHISGGLSLLMWSLRKQPSWNTNQTMTVVQVPEIANPTPLTSHITVSEGQYYILPHSTNDAAYDSLYAHRGEVYLFKMTLNHPHPISCPGLDSLRAMLERCSPHLVPGDSKPWHFVFVVPSDIASGYQEQESIGSDRSPWSSFLDQYVVAFDPPP